ncbi:Na+/melibiose symporter or related transporter (MelB) [Eupransor demetentiae]|uniref:Na+/melibiose symporter or related transporter (MelB) n=2 Tax=Eupransor demetentiae TaxID=3109584 RepID=A0ABP0ETG7_9LACO|nr:Na+/melibiose symporter or related transporter (MelB) [Lactobacillaceae bacterium LMG 33000]
MGGNLIGIYSGLYCLVAVIVTIFLARLKKENFRIALSIAMFLSAFSFGMMYFAHDLIWMTIAFVIFGAGWAGLNIYPVTFITDAVSREYMGSYIGLMNVQICIPQIAASLLSVVVLPLFKGSMPAMILFSAFFFLAAAFSSLLIKNKDI